MVLRNDQETKSSVFDRLSEDIESHKEKAEILRNSGIKGLPITKQRLSNKSEKCSQSLQWSRSKLGQAILFGKTSHQKHLETKLANIEKQKLLSVRNMEWKQLDLFRLLAKDKLDGIKDQEKCTASFHSSIERQKRREKENSRKKTDKLPSLVIPKSDTPRVNKTAIKSERLPLLNCKTSLVCENLPPLDKKALINRNNDKRK